MATVKIVSDPYNKKIAYFQKRGFKEEKWVEINEENSPNSRLLKDVLLHGFFPFYADKIVNIIIEDYWDEAERVSILFEGTKDEYDELSLICKEPEYQTRVHLKKSEEYLENARDILPDVILFFKELNPLLMETMKNDAEIINKLNKFSEVANDQIPICVVGNYSSGKSTFINALVGAEIMPGGDEPTTAKVYSISEEKQTQNARVIFQYVGENVEILIKEDACQFLSGDSDSKFIQNIKRSLAAIAEADIFYKVHIVLQAINHFANEDQNAKLSDLIQIKVPFRGGLWGLTDHKFVIFDTPGSNTATRGEHIDVLKKAMKGLSNGLPIYVSEMDSLDSKDNEKLIREIKNISELDSRFAMIVVNKADSASLPKEGLGGERVTKLLNEAIPRLLYAEGIFFVSSVMGLGSKTGGFFLDEHSGEIFDDQRKKYCDKSNPRYKQLYCYNIMPGKQKDHAVKAAEAQNDLLFINSGLYSVEWEIQNFAEKYSAYNKCQQAKQFLEEVIDKTAEYIEREQEKLEEAEKRNMQSLTEDKQKLIQHIKAEMMRMIGESKKKYREIMEVAEKVVCSIYLQDSLKDDFGGIMDELKDEQEFSSKKDKAGIARKQIQSHFVEHIREMLKKPRIGEIKSLRKELQGDIRCAAGERAELADLQKKLDMDAADQLFRKVNKDVKNNCAEAQELLKENSAKYWGTEAAEIRKNLARIVSGSSALSNEKKELLSDFILAYQNIDFEHHTEVDFQKEQFELIIKIFKVEIGKKNKINLDKLGRSYNRKMIRNIKMIGERVTKSHINCMENWQQGFYHRILENIFSYNPELRSRYKELRALRDAIDDMKQKKERILDYANAIEHEMAWKEI